MNIAVVCAPGVGDTLILHIVSHHLTLAGYNVTTFTPHRFGRWLSGYQFSDSDLSGFDAVFLQHDNSPKSKEIHNLQIPVYTFYGSHKEGKHRPLRKGFDYVCDPNQTMVDNIVIALQTLFQIRATTENGLKPPSGLIHRKFKKRVIVHSGSGNPIKNWPFEKFENCANWLKNEGFEPIFLPQFPTLEELLSFIYESGFLIGNDSGPGHIASYLKIPHLIIGPEEKQMLLWRPGWGHGEIIVPPKWVPNWKALRPHWKTFITTRSVINCFKGSVLNK